MAKQEDFDFDYPKKYYYSLPSRKREVIFLIGRGSKFLEKALNLFQLEITQDENDLSHIKVNQSQISNYR